MSREVRRCCVVLFVLAGLLVAPGCRSTDVNRETAEPQTPEAELRALAERAEAAIEEAGDSVGREYANRLRSEHRTAWMKYFKGEGPKPSRPPQKRVVKDFERLIELIAAAEDWPEPGEFRIPRASVSPVIDGKVDEEVWQEAKVWENIYPFNKSGAAGPPTTWRMLWDERALYFAFECEDDDIVAADRERDGQVFFDDCVEMFILPTFRFRSYWEIVIGPNGSVFDGAQTKRLKKWGTNPDPAQDVEGMQHAETIRGTLNQSDDTDEGYTVEVAVPFSQLPGYTRCGPEAGDRLHCMLVRLDRSHGQFKTYAFRPLQAWGHNIWNHAVMVLAKTGGDDG
jgi:hypothetical protein